MATTIQNSIDFAQPFIQYSPLAVGTANQPAIGIANDIQYMVVSAPFTWGWNRKEDSSLLTVPGVQDYTVPLTDFAFLETVTIIDSSGVAFEVDDVYNTRVLGVTDSTPNKRSRPNAACILSVVYGTSVKLRFMGSPDKAYSIVLSYQKLVTPMVALTGATGTWTIPDHFQDIFNNLFIGEAMAVVDEVRANVYRQRGVTALLSKSEGLDEMQKNAFLEHFWRRDERQAVSNLRAQQSQQARGV